jgi:hypothetical protein
MVYKRLSDWQFEIFNLTCFLKEKEYSKSSSLSVWGSHKLFFEEYENALLKCDAKDQNINNLMLHILLLAARTLHPTIHDIHVGGLCSGFLFTYRRAPSPGGGAPQLQWNNGPHLWCSRRSRDVLRQTRDRKASGDSHCPHSVSTILQTSLFVCVRHFTIFSILYSAEW